MMMADLGARVVKVERPGSGDDSRAYGPFVAGRSTYFARVNRGKESIALDLKDDADRAVLVALAERADVLIENFRPGVMDRLGLGWAALSARNPRLVYASVSGFGQTGPWRQRPGVRHGRAGRGRDVRHHRRPVDGPPTKMGTSIADLSAGLYVFGAVLAALRGRDRTGRGAQVDVAMFDSALSLLEGAALHYLARGTEPPRLGNAHHSISPFGTFRLRGRADRGVRRATTGSSACCARCSAARSWSPTRGSPTTAAGPRTGTSWPSSWRPRWPAPRRRTGWTRLDAAGVPCSPVGRVGRGAGLRAGGGPADGGQCRRAADAGQPDEDRAVPGPGGAARPARPGRARPGDPRPSWASAALSPLSPDATGNFSCAAIAAPTMPALLSSSAGFTGARRSSSGTHFSEFLLTPPPTTNRSGVNSFSTCRR